MKYVCEICGSSEIEEKAWIKINTGRVSSILEEGPVWCCDCEKETHIFYKDEVIIIKEK